MNPLLIIGVVVVAGLLGGALAVRLRLPRVTGYLAAGMLLSPSVLPLLSRQDLNGLEIVIFGALSIIGFAIGRSISLESVRALGSGILWITLSQGVVAWVLTTVLVAALGSLLFAVPDASWITVYLPAGLLIGAIAWPTAPAVTIALVRECRAAGPMTTATLVAVGLSDVFAVIAFALAVDVTVALMGEDAISFQGTAVLAARIGGALLLGALVGVAVAMVSRFVYRHRPLALAVILGAVLGCAGIAETLGLSAILACMVAGFAAANIASSRRLVDAAGSVEPLVLLVFLVLSGAYFNLGAFETSALLAVVITLARLVGKYAGAYLGAVLVGAPEAMRRYLGLALLPKAGLTIGLAFLAEDALGPTLGPIVFNGLLASTLINMVITPPLAKYAIAKSGEQGMATAPVPH